MPVIASIDIGSISVRLLVAEFSNGKIDPLYQTAEITRLGKGVNETRMLDEGAINSTLSVLDEYVRSAESFEAEKILAVGTSAIRDSINGAAFADAINRSSKIDFRIISGADEARLTFGGAYSSLGVSAPIMLIDVGGGSTEIVCGCREQIISETSIDAGAVRMTEKFLRHDPVTIEDYDTMKAAVMKMIKIPALKEAAKKCSFLVGVGGTITSLAAISQKLDKYDSKKIHLSRLRRSELDDIITDLVSMSNLERRRMIGLQPERADIIIGGAVIVQQIMVQFDWHEIIVSESDILDGMILNYYGVLNNRHSQ